MNVSGAVRFLCNQTVNTPLGMGTYLAPFAVLDGNGQTVVIGDLVRLPVNEQTRGALANSNCLTPKAAVSGLWVFKNGEVTS